MTRPVDLALIGVPKSGTTSLYSWLAAHPGVQGSEPKETFYFIEYDGSRAEAQTFDDEGWEGFERFFAEPRGDRLRLEGSPSNLFSDMALRAMAGLRTPPLAIAALRDPAEQIRSGFYYSQNNGVGGHVIDPGLTFAAYVKALLDSDPEPLKRAVAYDRLRWYLTECLERNKYVDWLDLWSDKLPPENLMVVRFEDLADRPREVLDRICAAASLDASFYDDYTFAHLNPTLARPDSRLRRVALRVHLAMPSGRFHTMLANAYRRLPAGQHMSGPSPDETAAMVALGNYFASSNRTLCEKYGVDTSGWWPRAES